VVHVRRVPLVPSHHDQLLGELSHLLLRAKAVQGSGKEAISKIQKEEGFVGKSLGKQIEFKAVSFVPNRLLLRQNPEI
jgi:hypothetical protein